MQFFINCFPKILSDEISWNFLITPSTKYSLRVYVYTAASWISISYVLTYKLRKAYFGVCFWRLVFLAYYLFKHFVSMTLTTKHVDVARKRYCLIRGCQGLYWITMLTSRLQPEHTLWLHRYALITNRKQPREPRGLRISVENEKKRKNFLLS